MAPDPITARAAGIFTVLYFVTIPGLQNEFDRAQLSRFLAENLQPPGLLKHPPPCRPQKIDVRARILGLRP